jgi:hypothetical protein
MEQEQEKKTRVYAVVTGGKPTCVADPDSGYGAFLTPGPGMGKKSRSGSGMNNPRELIYWG